jgi:hypothetical protein
MKKNIFGLSSLLFGCFVLLNSCGKTDLPTDITFTPLCQGVIDNDEAKVSEIMMDFTADLTPNATTDDPLGHEENLQKLVNALNEGTCLEVSIICYACIETLPAQSEIKVEVDLNGASVVRIMDISTPEDDTLKYIRMHE